MKVILKNSNLVFAKRVQKNSYNWDDISSSAGFIQNRVLKKNSGNVEVNSGGCISAPIMLEGATSIQAHAMDNSYQAKISFFNSSVSTETAVYYVNGEGTGQSANATFTIDSTIINAAMAEGADSFRVAFIKNATDGSINITRPSN